MGYSLHPGVHRLGVVPRKSPLGSLREVSGFRQQAGGAASISQIKLCGTVGASVPQHRVGGNVMIWGCCAPCCTMAEKLGNIAGGCRDPPTAQLQTVRGAGYGAAHLRAGQCPWELGSGTVSPWPSSAGVSGCACSAWLFVTRVGDGHSGKVGQHGAKEAGAWAVRTLTMAVSRPPAAPGAAALRAVPGSAAVLTWPCLLCTAELGAGSGEREGGGGQARGRLTRTRTCWRAQTRTRTWTWARSGPKHGCLGCGRG